MPGTCTRAAWPGLNPSLRFHSWGLGRTPSTLALSQSRLNATRRPVSVVSSGTVKRSLGNGSRQWRGSRGSQPRRRDSPLVSSEIDNRPSPTRDDV